MKLEGKVVALTGASSGMGRSLSVLLSKREKISGLAICDVNKAGLEETAQMCRDFGVKVHTAIVDVSSREQVEKWRDDVLREFNGAIDCLFNNAGLSCNGKLVYDDKDDVAALEKGWDTCFNVDFYGVLYCTKAFLPTLISRKEAHIINTGSVNSFWTWPEHSAYTAAKFAVKGLSDSLLIELKIKAPHVKVTCLHPGGVQTDVAKNVLDPRNNKSNPSAAKLHGKFESTAGLSADEAADWIVDAVKKDQYKVLVGYDAWLIDKMIRIFPTRVYDVYEQVGREGLCVDPFDPEGAERNKRLLSLSMFVRLMFSGLWTQLLFLGWVPLINLRKTFTGRAALYLLAGGSGYGIYRALGSSAKL